MPSETRPNGYLPITYVRLLYEYLSQQGVDADALLGPAPTPGQGMGRYPVADWQQMLQRAAGHLDDPLLGLHLGQTIAPRHLGLLGYVLLSCGTVGGALQRLAHYQRLIYDVNPLQISHAGDRLLLTWGVDQGRPGALVDETAITALLQFCRDMAADPIASPNRVTFVNPAPADLQPYERYFGCKVLFDQAQTVVEMDAGILATPLRSADPALIAVLEQQAEQLLAALPDNDNLLTRSRQVIAQQLRDGNPSLTSTAAALQVSERSLHRRLEEKGWNYRSLLQDTRMHLAKEYLADPRLQLSEIALLLGYSEQSAFTRAFQRQLGMSPLKYRKGQ